MDTDDLRSRVSRPEGRGLKVWGLGFGVWGLGFGIWDLGFRVYLVGLHAGDIALVLGDGADNNLAEAVQCTCACVFQDRIFSNMGAKG